MRYEDLDRWDKEYFWHPFTQMKVYREDENLIFERGEGVYIYDVKGRRFIDAISSLWCNIHGHNHPFINRAIINQLYKVSHTTTLGSSNVPSILLAKKLVEITPDGLNKVFYSEDGAEAMEIAIKMAFHYYKNLGENRDLFITFEEEYHGDTIGAVSVGGIELFHSTYEPLLFKTIKLPSPFRWAVEKYGREKALEEEAAEGYGLILEKVLKENKGKVAAVVMESGIQAAAGMLPFPKGLLRISRELTEKYNTLLILDEVATGFGRTGAMFSCMREGVSPDLMALGKGLTGGYLPLAATLSTDDIFDAFLGDLGDKRHFYHGHTYTGNNLACSAALANIEIFEREKTLERLPEKIAFLEKLLEPFNDHPIVGDVRQLGFMVGIEIVKDKEKMEPFPYGEGVGFKIAKLARKRGVFLRPLGDVMVLMPPLSISREELRIVVNALYDSIDEFYSSLIH